MEAEKIEKKGVLLIQMAKKIPKTITEKEFMIGIKKVDNSKYRLSFLLGFYQCMRVSEVCSLKATNIDKDRGYIHILAAKGDKDRDIPIMPPLKYALRHLPINVSHRQLQREIKKYWPDLKFHSLRHSGATFYLNEKKLDVRVIQQLLGHSRLDTTMIYTHVTPRNLQDRMYEQW